MRAAIKKILFDVRSTIELRSFSVCEKTGAAKALQIIQIYLNKILRSSIAITTDKINNRLINKINI